MELFRTYTKDYREIIEEARSKIEQASTLDGDERRAKLREAESALGDAEHIINSMSLTVKNVAPNQADEMSREISKFRQEIKNIRKELKNAKEKFDRQSLLGGTDVEALTSIEHRQALKGDTERLNETSATLKSAIQEGESAYETGVHTLTILHGQRQQIEAARENLGGLRGLIKDSQRIMRGIWSTMLSEDFIKVVIIIVLLFFICLIIYLRFIRRPGSGIPDIVPTPIPPPPTLEEEPPNVMPPL